MATTSELELLATVTSTSSTRVLVSKTLPLIGVAWTADAERQLVLWRRRYSIDSTSAAGPSCS